MNGLVFLRLGAWLFGLAAVASLWATPDLGASLPWVIQTVLGAALVLAGAEWARRAPGDRSSRYATRLLDAYLAGGWVVLAVMLLGTRWPTYKLSFLSSVYGALPSIRSLPLGFFAQGVPPNQAGGILATFVAFSLAPALRRLPPRNEPGALRRQHVVGARTLAAGGSLVVFMTGSRAALAAIMAALAVLLIARNRRWLWATAGLAGAGAVAAALDPSLLGHVLGLFLRDETLETKLVARLDIWSSVLAGIQDHAFTGIGLGVLNEVLPARYPYKSVGLSFTVTHAHNVFLDTALTLGLPGLLAMVCLFVGMSLLVFKEGMRQSPERTVAVGIMGAAIAFLVFGFTDSLSLSTPSSAFLWLWASTLPLVGKRGT
ncbi:MAG: hypothetical protein Kow00122_09260 [Thermoleophilia bacterium]